jgi:regulator of replication initiation timing
MATLIRDGEIAARVAEWEAAREAERKLLQAKLASINNTTTVTKDGQSTHPLHHHHNHRAHVHVASVVLPDPKRDPLGGTVNSDTALQSEPSSQTNSPHNGNGNHLMSVRSTSFTGPHQKDISACNQSFGSAYVGTPPQPSSTTSTPTTKTERRLEALETQMHRMRVALMNAVDENRFLRVEVDVLREALLGGAEARESAQQALELIGRRAGSQELRESVCTECLTRTRCYSCYACRSVEYCSSKCQMKNFVTHVALCRHISERAT